MNHYVEMLEKLVKGEVPPPPVAALVGFRITAFGEGVATAELDASGRHANPMGTLHGGIFCDLGDAAMGTAMATTLTGDETYTTLELKVNFFKPVWDAHLTAKARVVKRSRTIGYVECDVTDEQGSLVARLASTCLVLTGAAAKGR